MGRFSLAVTLVVLLPLRASAAATAPPAPPVPLPGIVVTGRALIDDVRVSVRCAGTNLVNDSALCRVEVRGQLHAIDEVTIQLPTAPSIATIDGDARGEFATIEADRTIALAFTFERELSVTVVDRDAPWIVWALRTRHLLLGESSSSHAEGDYASGELFGGQDLEISGTMHVSIDAGDVEVTMAGQSITGELDVRDPRGALALAITPPPEGVPAIQNGGPVLGIGLWGPIDAPDAPIAMRVAYEIGLVDWLIASVGFETDFHVIAESVLVEIASPELAILIPSIAVGVGAVFRQLGDAGSDAALRLALNYQFGPIGAYVDFDYWADDGTWSLAAGGRASL